MKRRLFAGSLPALLVALLAMTAGCSDDDGNGGTNPPPDTDLSGTYTLVSVQQGGPDALECGPSLGCTGTLTLTATRYTLDLTTPDPDNPFADPITIEDTGTYTTSGNEWTQTSDGNLPQSVGTYTLQGNTLTVAATSAGILVTSVWNKTS